MINELYYLSQRLNDCGVSADKIHPWIQPPKKGAALKLVLDSEADVKKIEYLDATRVATLWNIKQSNHKMFPIVNLKTPLWALNDPTKDREVLEFHKKKVSVANSIDRITQLVQEATFCFSNTKDLLNKLYQFPREALAMLVEDIQEYAAFNRLLAICTQFHSEEVIIRLIQEFSDRLLEALQQGRIDDEAIMHGALFGKWQEKDQRFGEESITLMFDVDDTDLPIECVSMSSVEMRGYINQRLFKTQVTEDGNVHGQKDAFGKSGLFVSKHPQPNLPLLGPSYLMSMNKDAPCHTRYGNIGAEVFPITEDVTNALSDAVIHLTRPENQHKTWGKVPSGKLGDNDLLIVYLEKMPDNDVEVAQTLGVGDANTDFETYASGVCDALRLKLSNQDYSVLRLLLLQSVSKGQRVIRFETGFTVKELYDAVQFWCNAARNIPSFSLFVREVKKANEREGQDSFIQILPTAPFLGKMFQELQFQWLNNGSSRKDLKGGRLGDMYQLFLHPTKINAAHYLEVVLRRIAPFLIRFKQEQAQPKRLRVWKDKEFEEYKRIVLDSVAFTGIVLKILGRQKEKYMKSSGYYVGRLLSLADLLHEQYCIHVRNKGDKSKGLPPQLLGNSLMRNAMDNPEQTLARLQERLMVYYAWATKEQGEHIGLAKWTMGQMGEISEALAEMKLPSRTDDTMKAEILLGYLAKPKKDKKEENNE